LLGCTPKVSLFAAPGVILNPFEVAPVNAGALDAVSVYPFPTLFIESELNVAMPPTAATGPPPASVPPPGFVPIANVTFRVSVVTRLSLASSIRTVTAGLIDVPACSLLGCTPNTSLFAAPGVILNPFEVAPVNEGALDAVSVYPFPVLFIESELNVAMPPTAATDPPPVSVPPPGFVPIAKETFRVSVVTRFPLASSIRTVTAGLIDVPACSFVGCTPNASLFADPGFTVKVLLVPFWPPPLVLVAVMVKFPVLDIVTLWDDNTPLTKLVVVPPPDDSVPVEVIFTVPVKLVAVLLVPSCAVIVMSKDVPAACVAIAPPPDASTTK
jgi:hypothetical protein